MNTAILFGFFFVLIFLTVPVGYAIGAAMLFTLILTDSNIPITMIAQNSVTGVDSFPLLAIPFFMLAGNLMSSGGIAKRLVNFFEIFVGGITGGLAVVTTLTSMFFGAISGSAVATTSAVGSFMIPSMEEKGYNKAFSASLTASAGTIGVIIPPSVPFVIYGVVANQSITSMFKAGFLPGIAMGIALIIASVIMSNKYGFKGNEKKYTIQEAWYVIKDAFWALMSPIIILGGIYSGIFTPTEAAVVSCIYSALVGALIYKELNLNGIYKALKDAIVINGSSTFMVGISTAFAAYLAMEKIPIQLVSLITGITDNKIAILLLINFMLLIVGCLIDNIPATIILTPILLPLVESLGMSPITFGIILTMNLAIGFVTPPYGVDLFVAQAISGVKMGQMFKYIKWFILALLIVLLLFTFCWPLTTFLL